jgi:hypothetical protein
MARIKRGDERHIRVEFFDGRGTANVWVVDGYGRPVSKIRHIVGVRNEAEARDEYRREVERD